MAKFTCQCGKKCISKLEVIPTPAGVSLLFKEEFDGNHFISEQVDIENGDIPVLCAVLSSAAECSTNSAFILRDGRKLYAAKRMKDHMQRPAVQVGIGCIDTDLSNLWQTFFVRVGYPTFRKILTTILSCYVNPTTV